MQAILDLVVPLILEGDDSKHLTEKQFANRVKILKKEYNIDILTTKGYFLIFLKFLMYIISRIRRLIKAMDFDNSNVFF